MSAQIIDLTQHFQAQQAARFRERVEPDGYWSRVYREIAQRRADVRERVRADFVRRYTGDGPGEAA